MTTTSGAVSARLEAFCDSSTKLAGGLTDALARLERLQYHAMLVTAPDGPLTRDSFIPPPGSAEKRLLDAIALHRGVATAIEHYAQLILALGRGDDGGQVEKQRHLFEAASEALDTSLSADTTGLRAADEQLGAEAAAATRGGPHGAIVTKLEAAGGHARFALGMVAKMAGDSTPGKVAGLVGMITDRITHHERSEEGLTLLGTMLGDVQGDFAGLTQAVVASEGPLTAAAGELADRLLEWSNAHRPKPDDPARFTYNTELASLLADAREIDVLVHAAADTAARLPEAHAELGRMAAAVPTDGEAMKALVKSAEGLARRRR